MPPQLPQQFGPYVLERFIAAGGMAEVFAARRTDGTLPGPVALKRMLQEMMKQAEYVTMFRDEAALSSRLVHNNIVRLFDYGVVDGSLYMAMELIDGFDVGTLVKRLQQKRELLGVAQALKIGVDLCNGLYHAHTLTDERGRPLQLIHRDVSPQNILISSRGEVKVTDFGIAKAVGRETKTATGMIKGKVQYMAPEQALGQQIDQRLDQFAAGIVVWELLTGQRLFAEKSELLTFEKIIRQQTPKPSSIRSAIPPAVDEAVLRALAKSPHDRWPDLNAFGTALAQALARLGGPAQADLAPVMAYVMGSAASAPLSAPPGATPAAAAPPAAVTQPAARTPTVPTRGVAVSSAEAVADTRISGKHPPAPRSGLAVSSPGFDPTRALSEAALRGQTPSTPLRSVLPPGVESRSDTQVRSQVIAAAGPRGVPIALLVGALAFGAIGGFFAGRSQQAPPAPADSCAVPSKQASDIDKAYALLGTAQGLIESADYVAAEDKANEANKISGSARGHYLLGQIKQRTGEVTGALTHFRCVMQLGAGGDDATRVEKLITGSVRQ